jgi:hypothetical protein
MVKKKWEDSDRYTIGIVMIILWCHDTRELIYAVPVPI